MGGNIRINHTPYIQHCGFIILQDRQQKNRVTLNVENLLTFINKSMWDVYRDDLK